MKVSIVTVALLLASVTSAIEAYTFNNDCYESSIGWICEDFCGPDRHFWVKPQLEVFCSLSGSDITSYYPPIPDCKAFDVSYCDLDWLNEQFDTNIEGLRANICGRHCEKGITAGGGLQNCYKTTTGAWDCMYRESPLPEVPAPKSHMHVMCPSLPVVEPIGGPGGCACEIHLDDLDDEYDEQNTCRSCKVLQGDEMDGSWHNYWDCFNIITGDCVGEDENGCISNIGGPSGSNVEPPDDDPFGSNVEPPDFDDPRDDFASSVAANLVFGLAPLLGLSIPFMF